MLFDEQVFRMAMKKLAAEGNRDAVEDYLLSEFWRLEEGDIAVADSCCCGKSACRLEEEDIAWQRNRLQGQIIVGSELADFYRENKEWRRCFDIYQSLEETVRQGGLSDTEVYGRIRINRAYALLDYGEEEQALELTDEVEALLTRCGSADGDSWSRLCHLQSVIYRRRGEEGRAAEALHNAADRIRSSTKEPKAQAGLLLNHAAALLQTGNPKEALRVLDDMILPHKDELQGDPSYFTAWNLKANILYQQKEFAGAAEAFAALLHAAQAAGALTQQQSVICRNCSKMYALAGNGEQARAYEAMAETL